MNTGMRYTFGRSKVKPSYNLFFGNMGGMTKSQFAAALRLYNLEFFEVDEFNNVRMKVTAWDNNTSFGNTPDFTNYFKSNCSFIFETEPLLTSLRSFYFGNISDPNFSIYSPKTNINILSNAWRAAFGNNRIFAMPYQTSLGSTGNDDIFFGADPGQDHIYDSALSTNNGGLPDGDIQYLNNIGANVTYHIPQTPPSIANNFSHVIQNTNDIVLSFDTSVNTKYLIVWVNGFVYKFIRNQDWDKTIYSTTKNKYLIEIQSADQYFNLSEKSEYNVNL